MWIVSVNLSILNVNIGQVSQITKSRVPQNFGSDEKEKGSGLPRFGGQTCQFTKDRNLLDEGDARERIALIDSLESANHDRLAVGNGDHAGNPVDLAWWRQSCRGTVLADHLTLTTETAELHLKF